MHRPRSAEAARALGEEPDLSAQRTLLMHTDDMNTDCPLRAAVACRTVTQNDQREIGESGAAKPQYTVLSTRESRSSITDTEAEAREIGGSALVVRRGSDLVDGCEVMHAIGRHVALHRAIVGTRASGDSDPRTRTRSPQR
jgi:hypothetical protein